MAMADRATEEARIVGEIRRLQDRASGEMRAVPAVPQPAPQPAPPPAAAPQIPRFEIKPPAPKAKPRRRHLRLFVSFLVMVLLPATICACYLWAFAADQYASRVAFSVRTEEQGSAIELLGGITELSGSSSSDTDILFAYLNSQELVAEVDAQVDLRAIWSRVPVAEDPVFAFDPEGTIEDLQAHWERKIAIVYDSGAGLIDLEVRAFDPQDAQRISAAILGTSAAMIDRLSRVAQQDAIRFTQAELDSAMTRVKDARQALTRFRNRTQVVDPTMDTQNQMGLLVNLQQQLAEALISADLLRETTRASDPRITQANRRIEVIEARIASEKRNLGLGEAGESDAAFANLVGTYEGLVVDREFAEAAYTAALAAHDAALAEVRRQSRYLAAHVKPTLAERALYPERLKLFVMATLFLFFSWALFCLTYYALRDRS